MAKDKTFFGPLPLRAISDTSLSSLEIRMLAAIAYHDRLSMSRGQGAGCWAGNQKLAELCGCRLDSVSAAVTVLVNKGYVTREPHPINKRLRVYRVNYDHDTRADAQVNSRATAQALPAEPVASDDHDTRADAQPSPKTLGQPKSQVSESIEKSGVEYITRKREDIRLKPEDILLKQGKIFRRNGRAPLRAATPSGFIDYEPASDIDALIAENREWEAAFDTRHPDYPEPSRYEYELASNDPLPDGIMEAITHSMRMAVVTDHRCAA